jgi:hypothetical protein
MARDRLQHLGHEHGPLRLVVDVLEELAQLRLREKDAPVLVLAPVHGHPDVVQERSKHDDDLRLVRRQAVVADERGLDAVLRQLAQELERDVGDDLDVHPRVVVDLEARDGVDVRDVPPRLDLRVVAHPLEELPELPVPARRHSQVHRRNRLRGREERLVRALERERLLDDLVGVAFCHAEQA